ncbi:MAG TPA: D-inositol-3-phosphate glycosyltransferase [Frankiaceae bacterium]|nr:D-inositol-3-phosphate glycosyltransferase [Frankiaceae bacterium]
MTVRPFPRDLRRVATISVHTSPLDQPGTGDAGGMNVYIVELSRRLAAMGIEVDIFTRTTSSSLDPVVELEPGITVRHVTAGPFEGLSKNDLPSQLCAFASGVLRAEAVNDPGHYDVVHSHYWLSGQVGWLAKERWGVPLVHSFHTLAKVKNAALADDDDPEPTAREIGEAQVVEAADRLVASTADEAAQLRDLYAADPARIATVAPGVDLERYTPGDRNAAKRLLGLTDDDVLLLFVGRIQPLKAPDVLIRAAAELVRRDPSLRSRLRVAVVGGPSGTGTRDPERLDALARHLDLTDVVRREPPVEPDRLVAYYRAAEAVVVPSYNESFGLVALEAQACGTPAVAAAVGGLRTAVRHGESGLLVSGHDPAEWATVLRRIVDDPAERARLSAGARQHAERFGWAATAAGTLQVYRDAIASLAATKPAVNA